MTLEKRLFIGIEIPNSYKASIAEIDPGIQGLRWLPPEQVHLTLGFLGNVNSGDAEALVEQLKQVRVPRFFVPLQSVRPAPHGVASGFEPEGCEARSIVSRQPLPSG